MPIRSRQDGDFGIGSADSEFEFFGIRLSEISKPKHHRHLEFLLCGKYNPFEENHPFELYCDSATIFYSSLWNLSCECVNRGKNVYAVADCIRYWVNTGTTSIDAIENGIIPEGYFRKDCRTPEIDSSFITESVIKTLSFEGIQKKDALDVVPKLVYSGHLSKRCFKEGSDLFSYGDARRHIISRILNEIDRTRQRMREKRYNHKLFLQLSKNETDPLIDMLTGRTLGV